MNFDYQGSWVMSDILEDRAERFGGRSAILTADESVTYLQLRDKAQRVAAQLSSLGLVPGDRVATMMSSPLENVYAWMGCAWSGAVEVPVNSELKHQFLEHILRESGAEIIVIQDCYVERLLEISVPALKHLIVVGSDVGDKIDDYQAHSFSDAFAYPPIPMAPRSEQDLLYILYTSGTTGLSKGVMHCNKGALHTARVWKEIAGLSDRDVGYSFLPLFHVTARSALIKACMLAGGRVFIRNKFSVSDFWNDVNAHQCTFTMYMGTIILFLLKEAAKTNEFDNPLRVAGGAACPDELAKEFKRRFGCNLLEVYGMTEIGTASGPRGGVVTPGTMGLPFDHLEIEIHDELDQPLPANVVGEIVARPREPYAMMQGYWNNPEATVKAWKNLWFHTGDLGKMTEQGHVVFEDRLKDAIRRRGENISSFEVEKCIQELPSVQECAVVAVPSEHLEDEVLAVISPREGDEIDLEELFEHCEKKLPKYAVPRYVRFEPVLPKTPTGRVQKHLLREEGVTDATIERKI